MNKMNKASCIENFIKNQDEEEFKKYGSLIVKNPILFKIINMENKNKLIEIILKYNDLIIEEKKIYSKSLNLFYLLEEIKKYDSNTQAMILFNFFPTWSNSDFSISTNKDPFSTPGIYMYQFLVKYGEIDFLTNFIYIFDQKIIIDKEFLSIPELKKLCIDHPFKFNIKYLKFLKEIIEPLPCYFAYFNDLISLMKIKSILTITIDDFLSYCLIPTHDIEITLNLFEMIDDFSQPVIFKNKKFFTEQLQPEDKKFLKICLKDKPNNLLKEYIFE